MTTFADSEVDSICASSSSSSLPFPSFYLPKGVPSSSSSSSLSSYLIHELLGPPKFDVAMTVFSILSSRFHYVHRRKVSTFPKWTIIIIIIIIAVVVVVVVVVIVFFNFINNPQFDVGYDSKRKDVCRNHSSMVVNIDDDSLLSV